MKREWASIYNSCTMKGWIPLLIKCRTKFTGYGIELVYPMGERETGTVNPERVCHLCRAIFGTGTSGTVRRSLASCPRCGRERRFFRLFAGS